MPQRILIVDDDENICDILGMYLESAGFETRSCGNARKAKEFLSTRLFDLVLLDVMLTDAQGFELCGVVKRSFNIPVILITARDMPKDKITGFSSGADDYIVKPFEPAEVIARVNARLRSAAKRELPKSVSLGDLTVDMVTYEVKKGGVPVDLKPKEIQLLHFLLLNRNIVFSRDALLERVWNYEFTGDTRTVDVHVKTLRQKLLDENSSWDIKTIWGVGYKLEEK